MKDKPYNLDPTFERILVTGCCSSTKLYGRVGYALDSALLSTKEATLAIDAAHAIRFDVGHGPGSTVAVAQRLRRWMGEGKVSLEQIQSVIELFDDAEDAGMLSEDEIVAEVAPLLKHRVREEAVREAISDHGKKGDLSKVVKLASKAQRIGSVDTSIGIIVGDASFKDIEELQQLERLPTWVVEIDSALDGGLQRGGLGMVIADSGVGKSMWLSHMAAVTALSGLNVCLATLELPRALQQARVISAMTEIPINAMLGSKSMMAKAKAKLRSLNDGSGWIAVQEFPPNGTTVDDINDWTGATEEFTGGICHLRIVDYGCKLTAKIPKGGDAGDYNAGKINWEAMRAWADESEPKRFAWTAAQSRGRAERKKSKRLGQGDIADSMWKTRISDLIVTMNPEGDEEDEMGYFIPKHRTAQSRLYVGPLPTEYEIGRVAPILSPQRAV